MKLPRRVTLRPRCPLATVLRLTSQRTSVRTWVGHNNVEVRIAGGPSQTFSLDKPYTMLELLQSTLDGYEQGSWKLTLDDYPVKHEDLITFFAPLARKGSTSKTALLKAEPIGLVGGGAGNAQLDTAKGKMREILQAKGLQGDALDSKVGEVMDSCSTKDILDWYPTVSWSTLKSLVGTKVTFVSKPRGTVDFKTRRTDPDPWNTHDP